MSGVAHRHRYRYCYCHCYYYHYNYYHYFYYYYYYYYYHYYHCHFIIITVIVIIIIIIIMIIVIIKSYIVEYISRFSHSASMIYYYDRLASNRLVWLHMITPWHGNAFRITGLNKLMNMYTLFNRRYAGVFNLLSYDSPTVFLLFLCVLLWGGGLGLKSANICNDFAVNTQWNSIKKDSMCVHWQGWIINLEGEISMWVNCARQLSNLITRNLKYVHAVQLKCGYFCRSVKGLCARFQRIFQQPWCCHRTVLCISLFFLWFQAVGSGATHLRMYCLAKKEVVQFTISHT